MKQMLFFLLIALFIGHPTLAQQKLLPRKVNPEIWQDSIKPLKTRYGHNKSYPGKYELAYLIALSRYPGLKHTHIEFSYQGLKTTMAARPKLNFIFKKASDREYIIAINARADELPAVSPASVPFNGQVGLLAHELAHIADYRTKTALGLIWDGIRYMFPGSKREFEKATDRRTIQHGAGWQLYNFADFVMNRSGAPRIYKQYKRDFYLEPHEIIEYMQEMGYPGTTQSDKPEKNPPPK